MRLADRDKASTVARSDHKSYNTHGSYGMPDDQAEVIRKALDRKQMSYSYHTTIPKFFHSQGPFAVYDHARHKGDNVEHDVGNVNQ